MEPARLLLIRQAILCSACIAFCLSRLEPVAVSCALHPCRRIGALRRRARALDQLTSNISSFGSGEAVLVAYQTPALTFGGRHFRLVCSCLVLFLGASAGCSSSDQVEQQSRTAASSAQTVSMTLEAWMAGAAPSAYTAGTLRSISRTLADAEAQIRSAGTAEPAEQAALTAAVRDLSGAVARAQAGLQAGNRTEVQNAQQDLRLASRSLSTAYARYFAPKS